MKREKARSPREAAARNGASPALGRLRAALEARRDLVSAIEPLLPAVARAAEIVAASLGRRGKVLVFGNGGSHALAMHLEAELVGRCTRDRAPLAAIALPGSGATLSALENDYGHEASLERALRALARPGDVAIALSTSGRSPNVVAAARAARELGVAAISLTGRDGGALAKLADVALRVASDETPVVQEAHQILAHLLVDAIESARSVR
jgi:D-sedoheptulose 7-phosphate isomerase